ncbi:hypothetical protein [Paraburkholderia sp. DHOC27]|uniref:hypothetical protein n=1 Tax=Paraburkholderia sp. DHOC27 TaxID=2303330 RepID=UPI000E3B7366|nr:hypothetical protein [Paraburkholderia sp. DHOC27]RFU47586.1 hypothetical protein D0B32_08410 [Paraburkholderia sp. DHOC27]
MQTEAQGFFTKLDPGAPELQRQLATLTPSEYWSSWHKLERTPDALASGETILITIELDRRYMICRLTRYQNVLTMRKIVFAPFELQEREEKEGWFWRTVHRLGQLRAVFAVAGAVATAGGFLLHELPWSIEVVRVADAAVPPHASAPLLGAPAASASGRVKVQ